MKYNKNEVTGKMRDRIILQNVNRSRSLTGFASESWADVATIWAFAESKLPGSNETIIDGKNTAKNVCDFTIRYISSITEESRVVWGDKLYQVKNIKVSHDRRFISFQGVYYDSYSTVFGLQFCSASLLAQSSLSAALIHVIKYQASLNAFGSVTADINFVHKVASSLNANALLVSDINFVQNMQAALNGTAALSGGINFVQKPETSLLTSSSVTGNIIIPKLVQASLTGAGTTTADLTVGSSVDADAAAFFARVTAAGGTLTITEKNAVNTLVVQMKAYGIWTKMKAIYPMVGASAAACAQNLKSASFTGTFTTGWTFASTGVTPNGTSALMDTNLNASTDITNSNFHMSFYSRTNNTAGVYSNEIYLNKVYESNGWVSLRICNKLPSGVIAGAVFGNDGNENVLASSTTAGYMVATETSATLRKVFKNNSIFGTNTNNSSTALSNANFTIGGYVSGYSNNQCALLSIGDGLTDAEAANFYTAVQAFQTTLNRQV